VRIGDGVRSKNSAEAEVVVIQRFEEPKIVVISATFSGLTMEDLGRMLISTF
jgi:hypothetical protein